MLGECPCILAVLPDLAGPAPAGSWLLPTRVPEPDGAPTRRVTGRRRPTLVNGWRRLAWGGVAAARPSFRQALRRLCFRQHRAALRLWRHAPPQPCSDPARPFPTSPMASPRRRAVGGGHLGGGSDQWARFSGVGTPAGLAAVWIGSVRHFAAAIARCAKKARGARSPL